MAGSRTFARRYTFKLYPSKAQEAALVRQAALLAHLWNAALEQRETQWAQECQRKPKGERKGLSKYDQGRDLKTIRANDPEYAAMGSDTMNLCLVALDDAFKAFFKRAKGGAGKSSGYPKYKSPYAIENKGADCTIWHREHRKGWRLDQAGKQFKVYAKGIPGLIKARGRFPVGMGELDLRDMRLIRVGGVWQLSVVVKMEARRVPGAHKATVEFDLIDQFASVKVGANGECLPGWEGDFQSPDEQIHPQSQWLEQQTAVDASEIGAEGRETILCATLGEAVDASEIGAEGRAAKTNDAGSIAVDASGIGAEGRDQGACVAIGMAVDASEIGAEGRRLVLMRPPRAAVDASEIQSTGDRRFKKFSYRWKQERRRVAKLKAKEARQRKEALHRWTTKLVAEVAELTVVCPPIKENTASARGDEKRHGAAVKTVAMLNRHVLAQAPAMAIQMLEYKADEAGIPFARFTPDEHKIAIGAQISSAAKAVRSTRRAIRKEKELLHV